MATKVKGSSWNSVDTLGYACILDYAAPTDGVSDCSTALALALATGAPVYIPPGTYVIGAFIPASGSIIFGAGRTSILKALAGINTALIQLNTLTNVILRNFAINGNKANQAGVGCHGVYVLGGSNHQLDNLYIYNTLGDGINIAGTCTDVFIRRPEITGFVKNGITIEKGSRYTLIEPNVYSSDGAANPGDGIQILPTAAPDSIASVVIQGGRSRSCVGRGLAIVGFGSKNVTNVTVHNFVAESCTSHGIHLLTTEKVLINGGMARSNGGDGYRLEGDTQNSRVLHAITEGNTGFGCREIVSGSTPNLNDLVGMVSTGNGTNTITKVGAGSLIPY